MSLLTRGKLIVSFSPSTLAPRAARIECRKRWDKSSCYWMLHLHFYVTEDEEKVMLSARSKHQGSIL